MKSSSVYSAVVLVCLVAAQVRSQSYSITTIAGSASQRAIIDGTNHLARFHTPRHSAIDVHGNIFVSDDCVIRKMTQMGTNWAVKTIAGLAGQRSSLDGTNSAARFRIASGIVVDSEGNLFVADYGSHTIRKITPVGDDWVVTTVAGIHNTSGSADGVGNEAQFSNPFGLAIDNSGNLFVADMSNETIRKVTLVGGNWVVTTVAGSAGQRGSIDGTNASARFRQPRGIAVDSAGNLYVCDRENSLVRQITPTFGGWFVSTIAGAALQKGSGDGNSSVARFSGPNGVALDGDGNLYVSDTSNNNLRKLVRVGSDWTVRTIAGLAGQSGSQDGTGIAARFDYPDDVQVDSAGNLILADRDNYVIRMGKPPLPTLALEVFQPGNELLLSWPSGYPNFILESASILPSTEWQAVTTSPVILNGKWVVTNSIEAGDRFFRLIRP